MSSLRNSATRLRTTVINRAVHPSQPDTPFCDTALQATPGGRQRVAQGLLRRLAAAGSAVLLPAIILAGAMTAMPVDAATPTKVRYEEVVRSILYMPMYVALDKGYFRDEGLDVSLKTSQGTDKGMAALLSGSADIVLIGPEASVYVANSESPVKTQVFAGLTATDGFLLLAREPGENFDWAKVKGKKVMSFRPGSNPDVFLETALKKHGLDPDKDLKLVSNIGPAARAGAWMAGQADYAIFLEPEASNLEKAGKGQVVASIGQEVGQVDFTSFTTTDAYIGKHPDVLKAWTRAIYRSQQYVRDAPPADLAKHMRPYFPGLSEAELIKAVERYRPYKLWKLDPVIQKAAMEKLQDMLIDTGLQKPDERVAYEKLVNTTFAKEAMQ